MKIMGKCVNCESRNTKIEKGKIICIQCGYMRKLVKKIKNKNNFNIR
jgi:hypothetical protein